LLPKREQSNKEEFRQGQRIRAYVLEVKKETKGPQIILSRTHPNLVKKLFELEVPEIYEGIVEIKAISRQAGERTKIAVLSKNDKVDSVGACVGMRGNRVRNIVSELQGEKIDIIRYNDDIREYIKAALSPAEVSEIRLNKESQKAEVIVGEDQLSLAIGKHGQNVRLASKLIGWELDIRTKSQIIEQEAAQEQEEKKKAKKKGVSLKELPGVGEKTIVSLNEAGINTIEDILNSNINDLQKIKGIGQKKAEKIILEAKKMKQ
jgi:N utilization substance protein A